MLEMTATSGSLAAMRSPGAGVGAMSSSPNRREKATKASSSSRWPLKRSTRLSFHAV